MRKVIQFLIAVVEAYQYLYYRLYARFLKSLGDTWGDFVALFIVSLLIDVSLFYPLNVWLFSLPGCFFEAFLLLSACFLLFLSILFNLFGAPFVRKFRGESAEQRRVRTRNVRWLLAVTLVWNVLYFCVLL